MAYFANSTEGEILDQQCADCPLGAGWNDPDQTKLFDDEPDMRPCPVAGVQLEFNYTQIKNRGLQPAMNRLIDNDGICQVRNERVASKNKS